MSKLCALSDNALNGDENSLNEIYNSYIVPIYKYVYVRIGNKEEAEDIAHTVFVKAFEAKKKKEIDITLNYLFTIARTTVIDFWRKKKNVNTDDFEIFDKIESKDIGAYEQAKQNDIRNIVTKAIARLEGNQKDVVIMKFVSDMTTKEIAKILNKTESNVRKIQSRAIEFLRKDPDFNRIIS